MARRWFAGVAVAGALAVGVVTAPAAEAKPHPLEFTRGLVQQLGLGPVLCQGTPLAPTLLCAVYNPGNEGYHNPYTPDGSSPGILGFGSLFGIL